MSIGSEEPRGHRRTLRGVVAGLAALAVVALPAAEAGFLALLSFTGCLIECREPAPAQGMLWAALGLGLLSLPVVVGALVARLPARRAAPWLLVPVLVLVATATLLPRFM